MKEPALSQTPPNGQRGARSPLLPLVLEGVAFAVGRQVLLGNINLEKYHRRYPRNGSSI